jgi:hypothetical protein
MVSGLKPGVHIRIDFRDVVLEGTFVDVGYYGLTSDGKTLRFNNGP